MSDIDLCVLFADADAERFVTRFIARGIERKCIREVTWRCIRDPMRDSRVAQQPLVSLAPFLNQPHTRFLVLWDHHGSGRESTPANEVEAGVVLTFAQASIVAGRVEAIAFRPEFEAILIASWDRVIAELAKKRARLPVAIPADPSDPKGALARALGEYQLKASSSFFGELADNLPMAALKGDETLNRIAERLVSWFAPLP